MDELNKGEKDRKELLKHMILQLHEGIAPEEVRGRLVALLKSIPYNEVVQVEQELINEGLPEEEVLKFCPTARLCVLTGSRHSISLPILNNEHHRTARIKQARR